MKRLGNLHINVNYAIDLSRPTGIDKEVTDEVYDGIQKIIQEGGEMWKSMVYTLRDPDIEIAYRWLIENMLMKHSYDITFGVESLEE